MRGRTAWMPAVVAATVIAAGAGCGSGSGGSGGGEREGGGSAAAAGAGRPNILFVMTDDQVTSTFTDAVMPQTRGFFADGGSVFDEALTAPPLCCPSRAGFLTGQYPHDSGVDTNNPGYPLLREKENVLPVWLHRAGYRTAVFGKQLNGYEFSDGIKPGPGFDRWFVPAAEPEYYDLDYSDDGELVHAGHSPRDYSTRVLTRETLDFLRDPATARSPFFIWLSYNAPHSSRLKYGPPCQTEAPQPPDLATYRRFAHARIPHPPSFDEPDISDKPYWARRKPLKPRELREITRWYRCELAALSGIDDGFEQVIKELRQSGRLDNTIVLLESDNGLYFGEHRISSDKRLPYEPALRVPMAIKVPARLGGDRSPKTIGGLVSNVDIAPTLLDYAGVRPCKRRGHCRRLDGRSFRPLVSGDAGAWPHDRAIPVELDDGYTYKALRTPSTLFVRTVADRHGPLGRPSYELYDLRNDPEELENLARSPRTVAERRALRRKLRRLTHCSGIEGRDPPSHRPFCE